MTTKATSEAITVSEVAFETFGSASWTDGPRRYRSRPRRRPLSLRAPFRETTEYEGLPVEWFCHTVESYEVFTEREIADRRSPLPHMCGEGVVLLDQEGFGHRIGEEARTRLRAGPPPLSASELEDRRYGLTGLLDDLAGADDSGELVFIADRLLIAVANLILAVRRRWRSHGKSPARLPAAGVRGRPCPLAARLHARPRRGGWPSPRGLPSRRSSLAHTSILA